MLEAAFWGAVSGGSLLVGATIALVVPLPQRAIALIMGFGAGVLIAALAFEMTEEAFARGGATPVAMGLGLGAIVFFTGDVLIERSGGGSRKDSSGSMAGGSAYAIVLGTIMDGIPESIAIGVSLVMGGSVGVAVVVAVFLSNLPEAMSATVGLRAAGRSSARIFGLWLSVTAVAAAASAGGFGLLGSASPGAIAWVLSFAAGAILTMLADTMIPEAFQEAGPPIGLATVLGFASAFFLSRY